jgi:hypothetical protein
LISPARETTNETRSRFRGAWLANAPHDADLRPEQSRKTRLHPRFRTRGAAQQARAPTRDELQDLLDKIIARLMKMLTRLGHLVEEQGMTCLADMDTDNALGSLQAASCAYRITRWGRAPDRRC